MTPASRISDWQAARTHPHTYPGLHPDGAFVLLDDAVLPIAEPGVTAGTLPAALDLLTVDNRPLNRVLRDRGLPVLQERYPVLAYGGNRNPATVSLKLQHYDYRSPGDGVAVPVLRAMLPGFDVVGAALSGQGYLYADLVAGPFSASTVLSVQVLLLDADQLRVMHDSEGVRSGFYDVGVLSGTQLTIGDGAFPVPALAYLARSGYFVSTTLGLPLAYASVRASGRALPAFDTIPMLAHALEACDLVDEVSAVVGGLPTDTSVEVAAELSRYLNGQWWFRRHTGLRGLRAAERLEALINERLGEHSVPVGDPDRLSGLGEWLTTEAAYTAPRALVG